MARIVCIHAHPDDAEMLAGGTLALLRGMGHAVVIISMTPGDCGSASSPPKEIARIRRHEAAEAAELISAEYCCAEFRDLAIFNTDEARRRVTELLRWTRPEVVLTASPIDYLCDHEATSVLVRDACFAASAPNYITNAAEPAPALPAIPHLYFVDPAAGVSRTGEAIEADFVVDVAETFPTKRAMLAKHASQRDWLRKQHGMDDYLETMESWTRERGRSSGVDYGEGFRRYAGHPYPQTAKLEELLGPHVIVTSHSHDDFP
jgi:LmbE family N-acetylglucosaminyl deacetylase